MKRHPRLCLVALIALSACNMHEPDVASTPVVDPAPASAATPDYAAIVAETARPQEDRAADAMRKPADMLAFAQVQSGMAVVDMLPGAGYFSRLFAGTVGDKGRVMLYVPDELVDKKWVPLEKAEALKDEMANPIVSVAHFPLAGPVPEAMGENFDVVWTSRNYHDFHNVDGFDAKAYNAMVLDLLKPGGIYVVLDHSAPQGAGASATDTTHRIEGEFVRREVESAGFLYDGSSAVLANPEDDGTKGVFDPALKGHTDQFVLRFRKPG
ncbi:class I SAM-dependent methyltransferase [Croceicoccus bisphenolivorans]|uniref:class I SAM-dependent methyltransferase n=1 Tax=Croceicoccus bisphenolivorans TaxID=1783232 RepID=UPI000B1061AF|nr:class I SAM-dependent methyltransferase [Croceicoccus bisphenolivorans]